MHWEKDAQCVTCAAGSHSHVGSAALGDTETMVFMPSFPTWMGISETKIARMFNKDTINIDREYELFRLCIEQALDK